MSDPRDRYDEYFAEKLWSWLPDVYRNEDGIAEEPGQLRALIQALALQAAHLKRSQDALWDDAFIDLCADWAVPYLSELVATRLVSALNPAGRRIDVAKTIYYRRRKGTLRVLEELIADIARWDGKVVEEFRRLARAWHGLDGKAALGRGRHTQTPAGGVANLRNVRGALLADSAFDEFHYTPDVRRARGRDGRYNIPKLGFHLYRLRAFALVGIDPLAWTTPAGEPLRYSIDPSGRDVPLFIPPTRGIHDVTAQPPAFIPAKQWLDWDQWHSAEEWEIASPMRCRVLSHAEYLIDDAAITRIRTLPGLPVLDANATADDIARFAGTTFPSEAKLRATLGLLEAYQALTVNRKRLVLRAVLASTLVGACGKAALVGDAISARALTVRLDGVNAVPREQFSGANLADWNRTADDKLALVDPNRGRLSVTLPAPPALAPRVDCYYGFSGPFGAGTYYRAGTLDPGVTRFIGGGGALAPIVDAEIVEWNDSRSYANPADIANVTVLTMQAADQQRPYVQLTQSWVISGSAGAHATLVIDGLWIGALAQTPGPISLTLRGEFDRVVLRHVTLDPGGVDAAGGTITPIQLRIEAAIERLEIAKSIIGVVRIRANGSAQAISISDSIVDGRNTPGATAATGRAIDAPLSLLELRRVSVLAPRRTLNDPLPWAYDLNVDVLDASDTLVAGRIDTTNTQAGCFRFSAAVAGSRVPHPYESALVEDTAGLFASQVFGDPAYAQLALSVPPAISRGAENDGEMGAFASLANPIRFDGLETKADEYMPFGRIPAFTFET